MKISGAFFTIVLSILLISNSLSYNVSIAYTAVFSSPTSTANSATPTPQTTTTQTPSTTQTPQTTNTQTPSTTQTPQTTTTQTPSATPTPQTTTTQTPSATQTPQTTNTQTPSATPTPQTTNTQTPSATPTPQTTNTQTPSATPTPQTTNTQTPSATPTPQTTQTPGTITSFSPSMKPSNMATPKNTPVPAGLKISGFLILQQPAPEKGLSITITISGKSLSSKSLSAKSLSSKGEGTIFTTSTVVSIKKGSKKATWLVIVPVKNSVCTIKYRTNSIYKDFASEGYYSVKGTSSSPGLATPVSINRNISGISITLLKGIAIEGNISLPSGKKAPPGGLLFSVSVASNNNTQYDTRDDVLIYRTVTIPEGKSFFAYSITVPANGRYIIGYTPASNVHGYLNGYYSDKGTKTDISQATYLDTEKIRSLINKALQSSKDKKALEKVRFNMEIIAGRIISGTIYMTEIQKGISVITSAIPCIPDEKSGAVKVADKFLPGFRQSIIKNPDGRSFIFTITVPAYHSFNTGNNNKAGLTPTSSKTPKTSSSYIIKFITNAVGYEKVFYYSKAGSVKDITKAGSIDVSKSDIRGLRLEFLKAM